MTKNNKGITLVALTITIIALLILSGITVSILKGDNGMVNHATTAKKAADLGKAKEEIQNEWHKLEFNEANSNIEFKDMAEKFKQKLQEYDNSATVTYQEETNTMKIKYKGFELEMTESLKLKEIQ